MMRRAVPGRYIVGDIMETSLSDEFRDDPFEVIVFGDVIEHLDNFGIALRNLRGMLSLPMAKSLSRPPTPSLSLLLLKCFSVMT